MNSATIGPVSVTSTVFKVGTGTFGNANTQLFIDSDGKFSLGDKLTFDQNGNLSMNGAITIAAGSTSAVDFGLGAAASASAAQSNAESFATTAAGNAATSASAAQSNAESFATTASGNAALSASAAQSSATAAAQSATAAAQAAAAAQAGVTANAAGIGGLNSFTSSLGAMAAIDSINSGTSTTYIGAGSIVTSQVATNLVTSTNYSYSSGNFSTAGSTFDLSSGDIITPGMRVTSTGDAYFKGTVTAGAVSTGVSISSGATLTDGTNTKAWSTLFEIDSSEVKLKSTALVGTTRLSTRFSTYDGYGTSISSLNTDFNDLASFAQENCVLPGTKIITKRGEVNIEDTTKEDLIKVFDFETNKWRWSSIDKIIVGKSKGWSIIKTESGKELRCSKSHSLYHPDFKEQTQPVSFLSEGSEIYTVIDGELVLDKVKSIERFKEEVDVWNYHLSIVHNYISDGILSHNIQLLKEVFTAGHQYVKLNSESVDVGDLVKLDSNNQIIKSTTAKDTEIVGILWKEPRSGSDAYDSLGDTFAENERDTKTMWKVASIGDSYESGSRSLLPGFKVCNQGGDVSRGDLLCSSDTAGYLMKQPPEFVITSFDGDNNPQYEARQSQCSYTVAKAMEDVTFDSSGLAVGVYGYLYCG
jgi:hypothetical protein